MRFCRFCFVIRQKHRVEYMYHLQLLPQGTDGSLLTGNQFLQVLVPQLLPGSAFPCALTAPLQLCLQVDLCRFAATFTRFFHFSTHHLWTEMTKCCFQCWHVVSIIFRDLPFTEYQKVEVSAVLSSKYNCTTDNNLEKIGNMCRAHLQAGLMH